MKLVIHNGSRVWGGNEKWAATLAAGLRERGHEVVVSCRAEGPVRERMEERGIRTSSVRPGGDLDLFSALRFSRWLRRESPDVVLATSWNRVPSVAWAARRAGVPRLVVRLGIVRTLRRRRRHAWFFRHRVSAMIVNSTEIRDVWLRAVPWFPEGAVHVIHNGVPEPEPRPADDRARVREELGVPTAAPLIVGVGHLYPRKGFDLLIDAVAALPIPDVWLAVVGSGTHEEELRARAVLHGVQDRVVWPGFRSDATRIVAAGDVFVLSSRNEGMANVMLEAMSVGTPVVAARVSGVTEALGPEAEGGEPAGWIVPPESVPELTVALAELLRDLRERPEWVARRVGEAHRRVRESFSVARMVDRAEAVLLGEAP